MYLSLGIFHNQFGGHVTVPEAQVDAFGQDHVPPVVGSFKDPITGKPIHYWTKLIANLLEVSVATYTQERNLKKLL
jgi:hypothetical protein